MTARSNNTNSVLDMVHWYNTTPKYGTNSCTAPAAMTYKYSWRVPTLSKESTIAIEDVDNRHKIGDEVFVKPPVSRCTIPWGKGVVSEINSDNNVEVNGIPRHVADLRRVPDIQAHEAAGNPDPGADINIEKKTKKHHNTLPHPQKKLSKIYQQFNLYLTIYFQPPHPPPKYIYIYNNLKSSPLDRH